MSTRSTRKFESSAIRKAIPARLGRRWRATDTVPSSKRTLRRTATAIESAGRLGWTWLRYRVGEGTFSAESTFQEAGPGAPRTAKSKKAGGSVKPSASKWFLILSADKPAATQASARKARTVFFDRIIAANKQTIRTNIPPDGEGASQDVPPREGWLPFRSRPRERRETQGDAGFRRTRGTGGGRGFSPFPHRSLGGEPGRCRGKARRRGRRHRSPSAQGASVERFFAPVQRRHLRAFPCHSEERSDEE